jgi:uncharacterized phage protein (TIGR01671 family)
MREITFRTWDKKLGGMEWPEQIYNQMQSDGTYKAYMQYTGLKDKNGKEIYEGDICLFDTAPVRMRVEYENGSYRLTHKVVGVSDSCDLYTAIGIGLAVVGNIYEHPNLLTNEK